MKKDLAEEYIKLIKIAKEKKKENEVLYPIYKDINALLKEIQTTRELRLDAFLVNEIIDEESKRILLQCNNTITLNMYVDLVSTNLQVHRELANTHYRGAYLPPLLPLTGTVNRAVRKEKKQRVEKEQETPEEIKENTEEINVPKEIKKLYTVLKEKKEIEVFRLVINIDSFSKTVENLLTLSFAVKVGRAFLLEKNGVLYVSVNKIGEKKSSCCTISVCQQEIEELIKEMKITENLM